MINLRYVSSSGKAISFRTDKINVSEGTVHGRKWKPKTTDYNVGSRVEYWTKEPYEIPLTITCRGTKRERLTAMNNLHDLFESDIAKNKPGKLWYGEWYCECFISSSTPKMSEVRPTWIDQEVTVYVPSATWWKEEKVVIQKIGDNESETEIVEYPTLYPFTYPIVKEKLVQIENDHYDASDFIMIIYGPTTGVDISISGNRYKVNYPLEAGEIMTIDSRSGKEADERCYVTGITGVKTNVYNYRDSAYSLFEKIPEGNINVQYSRLYAVDLTLLRGRSEPEWQW